MNCDICETKIIDSVLHVFDVNCLCGRPGCVGKRKMYTCGPCNEGLIILKANNPPEQRPWDIKEVWAIN